MSLDTAPMLDVDALLEAVQNSEIPLRLSDLAKQFKRPGKVKAVDWSSHLQDVLDRAVRENRLFAAPSGRKGQIRYWCRDESTWIDELLNHVASQPKTLSQLVKDLSRSAGGADPKFVKRELEKAQSRGRLFQHPGRSARTVLWAIVPPAKWDHPKHQKTLQSTIAKIRQLVTEAEVTLEEVLDRIRADFAVAAQNGIGPTPLSLVPETLADHCVTELSERILAALREKPVLSIPRLRDEMPPELQGPIFDETVLQLAEQDRIVLGRDVELSSLTDEQRSRCVQDGWNVVTTISRGRLS
jgi:hypothetical protein